MSNEDFAKKVDRLHTDLVEVKTLLKALVEGRVIERLAVMETKVMVLMGAASFLFASVVGLAIKVIWGG